jgi:hypothetical protein
VLLLILLAGCPRSAEDSPSRRSPSVFQQRSDSGQAFVESVVSQLRDLPSYVDLELNPPTVVLDSTTSADRQDVMATIGAGQQPPDGTGPPRYNLLVATSGNGRFRSLVNSGDTIKFYVPYDEATEDAIFRTQGGTADGGDTVTWSGGMVREVAIDLKVAQVVSDNALIMEQSLIPIETPSKIEIWRYSDDRMIEVGRRLGRYARRGIPSLAWEPSPDEHVLLQIVERLNQWLRQAIQRWSGKHQNFSTHSRRHFATKSLSNRSSRTKGLGKEISTHSTGG